jgi:hypothetical protein
MKEAQMSRTNELRKLINSQLKTLYDEVYYLQANESAMYPHCVFLLESINTGDLSRSDFLLKIDLWDKSSSSYNIEESADKVTESRKTVVDDDKKIKHIQLDLTIQLYER